MFFVVIYLFSLLYSINFYLFTYFFFLFFVCLGAILNFEMLSFYEKRLNDFVDSQRENGGITETAPFVGIADNGK
jgi:alpha-L-rhamnosidase